MNEAIVGRATAHFAPILKNSEVNIAAERRGKYPAWVMPTFIAMGFLAAADMIALIFAPLFGSVPLEMILGIVLAISLFGMSAAVRRVAIIRGER